MGTEAQNYGVKTFNKYDWYEWYIKKSVHLRPM